MADPTPQQVNRLSYESIARRPKWKWSNGARVAVLIVPNIEYFSITQPGTDLSARAAPLKPDIPNHTWREYGARVGVWRLMELMDRFHVRGTVALNAAVCDHYPDILNQAREQQWEFMGHGWTNSQRMPGLSEDDERALIRRVRDRMKAFFGVAPRGWLSPALLGNWATPDLLKEEGYDYTCDWIHDDQPTWLATRAGHLMTMPYSLELNDLPVFLTRHQTPEDFTRMIQAHFDQLYEDGAQCARAMTIALHPFAIGTPYRIHGLANALRYLQGRSEVWFATGSELADDFLKQTAAIRAAES